jgi:hypothetical protein
MAEYVPSVHSSWIEMTISIVSKSSVGLSEV